jgi:hypothetical protein
MGTKRKARKPAKQPVSETVRETAEIVALLRDLREKMALVEELEPDNRMLREYRYMRGWAIIDAGFPAWGPADFPSSVPP